MNKKQMLQTLKDGYKVTHIFFNDEEWMKIHPVYDLEFEDGCLCSFNQFWETRTDNQWNSGWSIWK